MERQQRKENPNSSYVNMLFLLTTRYLDIEESNISSIEVCVPGLRNRNSPRLTQTPGIIRWIQR